jgi:hypothetical protein
MCRSLLLERWQLVLVLVWKNWERLSMWVCSLWRSCFISVSFTWFAADGVSHGGCWYWFILLVGIAEAWARAGFCLLLLRAVWLRVVGICIQHCARRKSFARCFSLSFLQRSPTLSFVRNAVWLVFCNNGRGERC